jgi:catechol 2,3-dioxygenase-like lactoylglutathione lyase family enzyme
MIMRLGHIETFVKEPLKSKDFYIQIFGFELIEVQHEKFVWLKQRESVILLRPGNHLNSKTYQQTDIAFVMYSDNINGALAELKSNNIEIKGDDGDGCYTFTDPDGNWI